MKHALTRLLAVAILLALMLGCIVALPATAEEPRVSLDKNEYIVDEPIMVTAYGENADWVGLYKASHDFNDPENKASAAYWYYVNQNGHYSGETLDLHYADNVNSQDAPDMMGIPVGEYKLILFLNDTYEILEEVYFTVREATAADRIPAEAKNIALGAWVDVTSSFTCDLFNPDFLVDGVYEKLPTLGWCSQTMGGSTEDCYITLTLDQVYTIYQIILKPTMWDSGDPFPSDYELQVSEDAENWVTLFTETDKNIVPEKPADAPESWDPNDNLSPVVYTPETPVVAEYFRIKITEHGMDVRESFNDVPFSEIGEIELIGLAYVEETEPETTIPETEPVTTAPEAEETTLPANEETTPAIEETTAASEETTVPYVETPSAGEAPTEPAATGDAKESDTGKSADEGCASVIGLSALVLMAAAAFVVGKRK